MCAIVLNYGFEIYLENMKTIRTIAQIFVAFSEKLNFNGMLWGIMSILGGYSQILLAYLAPNWASF